MKKEKYVTRKDIGELFQWIFLTPFSWAIAFISGFLCWGALNTMCVSDWCIKTGETLAAAILICISFLMTLFLAIAPIVVVIIKSKKVMGDA